MASEFLGVSAVKFLSVISFLLVSSTLFANDVENQVRVAEVKGSAQIRLAVDQEWSDLKVGDLIPEGAWIQTAFRSKVYLKFWNNTVVQVKSASLVQIKGLSHNGSSMGGRLHLSLGSARVRVKPDRKEMVDFKIVTPGMTTSIKGTEVDLKNCGSAGIITDIREGSVFNENTLAGYVGSQGARQDPVKNGFTSHRVGKYDQVKPGFTKGTGTKKEREKTSNAKKKETFKFAEKEKEAAKSSTPSSPKPPSPPNLTAPK